MAEQISDHLLLQLGEFTGRPDMENRRSTLKIADGIVVMLYVNIVPSECHDHRSDVGPTEHGIASGAHGRGCVVSANEELWVGLDGGSSRGLAGGRAMTTNILDTT